MTQSTEFVDYSLKYVVFSEMENVSKSRQDILTMLKEHGPSTTAEIAEHLSISYEAARQQVIQLKNKGFVEEQSDRENGTRGRPAKKIRLSQDGENLFPKAYDELAVELLDTVADDLGPAALKKLLERFTERRVEQWREELEGLPLEEKLERLQDLYATDDPFTEVHREDGELYLIERNCPFLNVARRRPALCSVTVSTLQRLLGYRVERVQRFQDGDGFCAFHIRTDQPLERPPSFSFEESVDSP